MKQCENCVAERCSCPICIYNPLNKIARDEDRENREFKCPRGNKTCVSDPAFIKENYPEWYELIFKTKDASEFMCDKEWMEDAMMAFRGMHGCCTGKEQ